MTSPVLVAEALYAERAYSGRLQARLAEVVHEIDKAIGAVDDVVEQLATWHQDGGVVDVTLLEDPVARLRGLRETLHRVELLGGMS
jgi:alkanesulfonate monooxygenase SsuD/methylene tetrahydromethanopterin reductase-like flavin-dependent oxidoreductase (luciferase family)